MNALKCDRCGKFCNGGCFTDHQIIKTKGVCVGDNVAVYLCEDCQNQLEKWLLSLSKPEVDNDAE